MSDDYRWLIGFRVYEVQVSTDGRFLKLWLYKAGQPVCVVTNLTDRDSILQARKAKLDPSPPPG